MSEPRVQLPVDDPLVLVTMHLPLDMHCVAVILKAVADAYPDAVLGEDGQILRRRPSSQEEAQ
jgi:hypothetical protein